MWRSLRRRHGGTTDGKYRPTAKGRAAAVELSARVRADLVMITVVKINTHRSILTRSTPNGRPQRMTTPTTATNTTVQRSALLERMALRCCAWSERWIPDAYVFAVLAVVIVALAALAL